MIGSLRGTVLERRPRGDHSVDVLLEVGGVGYRVVVPAGGAARLAEAGGTAFVHVHTHVREDAIVLFGFPSREERTCFEALIGAHGVGPAVGLALLSVHSPTALRRAVATDDLDALMMVPGIGKKTAARLVIELKARLDVDAEGPDLVAVSAAPNGGNGAAASRQEVRGALASLGYGAEEIRPVLAQLPPDGAVEDLVRAALRQLAAGP